VRKSWFINRFDHYPLLDSLLNGKTVTGANASASCCPSQRASEAVVVSDRISEEDSIVPASPGNYDSDFDHNGDEKIPPKQLLFTPSSARKRSAQDGQTSGKRHRPNAGTKLCEEVKQLNMTLLEDSTAIQSLVRNSQQARDYLQEALAILQKTFNSDQGMLDVMIECINVLQDPIKAKTCVLLDEIYRNAWLKSQASKAEQ
jgi:hypothetical protein